MKRLILLTALTASLIKADATAADTKANTPVAPQTLPAETDAQKAERMDWWRDARFGLFIHWGLYALPARHEWVKKYEQLTDADYREVFRALRPGPLRSPASGRGWPEPPG